MPNKKKGTKVPAKKHVVSVDKILEITLGIEQLLSLIKGLRNSPTIKTVGPVTEAPQKRDTVR